MSEKKALSEMSDHDLLVTIAQKNTAAEHHRRISAIALVTIAAVIVISAALILPRTLQLLNNINNDAVQAADLLERAAPAADGLSRVDFDGLNSAIADLQSAAAALAKITGIFN